MKHALMTYLAKGKLYKNIGDYIQSVAAGQFLRHDVYIEREHLHEYEGEKTKVIMNGWFMHYPKNFPPSESIEPLFVSFHINPKAKDELLSEKTVAYLKRHAPIGCRDHHTAEILQQRGVSAYFSGCLTLTLGETYKNIPAERDGKVYIVDPFILLEKSRAAKVRIMLHFLKHARAVLRIARKIKRSNWKKADRLASAKILLYAAFFHKAYASKFDQKLLLDAEYITHVVLEPQFKTEEQKFQYADTLLRKYSKASLVITSKIHCALPCTAMGTPVIFVNHPKLDPDTALSGGRLEGLLDLFNVLEYRKQSLKPSEGFNPGKGKIDLSTPVPIKRGHLEHSQKLVKLCREFARDDWQKPQPVEAA
jgi:hypothetical protein